MATWGVHLRVARCFIDNLIAKKYHREFVIGSVAPDCGYGVKDSFGEFTPPPKITHWSPSGMKRDCRYNDFQKEYLNDKSNAELLVLPWVLCAFADGYNVVGYDVYADKG